MSRLVPRVEALATVNSNSTRLPRRALAAWGTAIATLDVMPRTAAAQAAPAAERARPEPGDKLVFAATDRAREPIVPDALPLGGPLVLAWAIHPESGVVRNASRLNQVVLVRLDPAELAGETRDRAAGGVVAYSAVCTHQQCPVAAWMRDKRVLHCPCHGSEFDPYDAGRVVAGPAPRALPALPLKLDEDNALAVAAGFSSRVGGQTG